MTRRQPLFRLVATEGNPAVRGAMHPNEVYTWGNEVRDILLELSASGCEAPMELTDEGATYGWTYSVRGLPPLVVQSRAESLAQSLLRFARHREVVFFKGMLDGGVTVTGLRLFFAFLRDAFVRRLTNPLAALVSPLHPAKAAHSEFPLHADAFGATRLLNIFVDVPSQGSRITILPVGTFASCMAESGIPPTLRQRALSLVARTACTEDGFDELMSLLYAGDRPWSADFSALARDAAFSFAMRSGEGYLLDDTSYLHGRSMVEGGVSSDRLVRFLFSKQFMDCRPRNRHRGPQVERGKGEWLLPIDKAVRSNSDALAISVLPAATAKSLTSE